MLIKEIDNNNSKIWIDFFKENLNACFHHAFCYNWKLILENVFKHKSYYLAAIDEATNKTQGILPLFHLNSFLFGSSLISIPYLNAGGIFALNETAFTSLYDYASNLAKSLNVSYVELRHLSESNYKYENSTSRSHKVSMQLTMLNSAEEVFNSFPPKLRSQIRRPSKSGCYAKISGIQINTEDSLSAFYSVFSKHMRNLGTPVYPKKLFSETAKIFGSDCNIYTVWHEGEPISAAMTISTGVYTEVPWAASLASYNKLSPNMLLYWEIIKHSVLNGTKLFDFGRSSPDSGTYKFKQQWGAIPVNLHWYYLNISKVIPDVNPKSKQFAPLVACWKYLPLSIANALGAVLTRGIP